MKRRISVQASCRTNRSRNIMAAKDPDQVHPALASLSNEAYHAGYDLLVSGDSLENVSLELIAQEKTNIMPKITIWVDTSEMNSQGVVYYDCKVKFPVINSVDLEFADSAEYIVDQFQRVAKFVTWTQKNPIILDHYEDDEE